MLAVTWIVYVPGLTGGFVFDDFGTLPSLGDYGRVDNWTSFLRYLTSGIADPTGRPLAMLSFLIDADNWPADPASFKRTNVLIHLFNTALLFALLVRLGRLTLTTTAHTRTVAAALLGAAIWALHPLWASTVLYVVQREAMLSGMFILLGLLAYLHGRSLIELHPARAAAWIVGGVGVCNFARLLVESQWCSPAIACGHRRMDLNSITAASRRAVADLVTLLRHHNFACALRCSRTCCMRLCTVCCSAFRRLGHGRLASASCPSHASSSTIWSGLSRRGRIFDRTVQ